LKYSKECTCSKPCRLGKVETNFPSKQRNYSAQYSTKDPAEYNKVTFTDFTILKNQSKCADIKVLIKV
jgi:hypothetical protein